MYYDFISKKSFYKKNNLKTKLLDMASELIKGYFIDED